MTDDKIVEAMARAIEERRDELIHQPIARIYGELARAALSVARPMIEAEARRAGAEEMREMAEVVIEEIRSVFASDEYATGQPLSPFPEQFACTQILNAILALPLEGQMNEVKTKREFIEAYIERSGLQTAKTDYGFAVEGVRMFALRCQCGEDECEGWAMVPEYLLSSHLQNNTQDVP